MGRIYTSIRTPVKIEILVKNMDLIVREYSIFIGQYKSNMFRKKENMNEMKKKKTGMDIFLVFILSDSALPRH